MWLKKFQTVCICLRRILMCYINRIRRNDNNHQYTVISGCIRDENVDNYVGIIVENTNPKYEAVIADFNETLEMLQAHK